MADAVQQTTEARLLDRRMGLQYCEGKTVRKISIGVDAHGRAGGTDSLVIVFTDGTWVGVVARESYGDVELREEIRTVGPFEYDVVGLDAGLFTREEFKAHCEQQKLLIASEELDRRRQRYQELRAEFEPQADQSRP